MRGIRKQKGLAMGKTFVIDNKKKKRIITSFDNSTSILSVLTSNPQPVVNRAREVSSLENAEKCPVFRCACLGPVCTAYEITKETSYFDKEKKQWLGLSVVLELKLPKEQERVEKHVVIIHGCRYQGQSKDAEILLRQTHKNYDLPESLADSL